jgi:hypothetical protein
MGRLSLKQTSSTEASDMETHKKHLRHLLSALIFLLLLGLALWRIHAIFAYDYSNTWYLDERLDQLNSYGEGEIDALYVGGSKVAVGIAPILIWQETGLTGINIATNSQPPLLTKYLTEKYARKLKPQYVFIDVAGIATSSALSDDEPYRFETGLQLTDQYTERWTVMHAHKSDFPDDDIREYLVPLYRDHSRWRSLSQRDFEKDKEYLPCLLGGVNETAIRNEKLTLDRKTHYTDYDCKNNADDISLGYYQELIDLLKEQGIEVIVLNLPDVGRPDRVFASKIFAEENDLTFIDMSIDPTFNRMAFEQKGDFYDTGHLSITGAHKYSSFLGQQLRDVYGISQDSRSDTDPIRVEFSQYYEDYRLYYEARKGAFTKYYE